MNLWFLFTEYAPEIFVAGIATIVVADLATRLFKGRELPLTEMKLSTVSAAFFMVAKFAAKYSIILPIHLFVYQFRLFELDLASPYTWLLVFLIRDFVSYWAHRLEHKVSWLWASHAIHHSFEEMTPSCSIRLPWMENFYKVPFTLWMPLMGFDIRMVVAIDILAALISVAQHNEFFKANPNGLMQKVFIVPSHHRVHHGTNEKYLDKNFGAVLCVWDKAFGTFQPETEPATYGILGRPLNSPKDMLLGKYPDLISSISTKLKGIPIYYRSHHY